MNHELFADPHLNLFRRYGLKEATPEHENNVTQALVNALRLSDPRVTKLVLTDLAPELGTLPIDWSDVGFGLQRPPEEQPPSGFQHRVIIAISREGVRADEPQGDGAANATPEAELEEEAPQGSGRPDGWIYTRTTPTLCILLETKVWGAVDAEQIRRHEQTHFTEAAATLRRLDLRWANLSRAVDKAYERHPNPVLDEFLAFVAGEGLAPTLRFDPPTVRRAGKWVPRDVMEDLLGRLRKELHPVSEELTRLIRHVFMFRNFPAVGNIEVYLNSREESAADVSVVTELSLGTAQAGPDANLLTMPNQIARLIENLANEDISRRFIEAACAARRPLMWTVFDRPRRAQRIDWRFRKSDEIAENLSGAGRPLPADAEMCFGEDRPIPVERLDQVREGLRLLHRAGEVQSGSFKGYSLFARAYLSDLRVPAHGRRPEEVLP